MAFDSGKPMSVTGHVTDTTNLAPQQPNQLNRMSTADSVQSFSTRSSNAGESVPSSPATNVTIPSPASSFTHISHTYSMDGAIKGDEAPSSYFSLCGHCKGVVSSSPPVICCLICSSANKASVIPNLCHQCYATGASWNGHNHHISYYGCDIDSILPGTGTLEQTWIVRRNSAKRLWYEHRQSGYKTYMRPMTAVGGLPAGWQVRTDPEGNAFYENTVTGERSRTLPGSLPLGWRETKDPDGKSFFVHDQLQIASWHRPGEQPPGRKIVSGQNQNPAASNAAIQSLSVTGRPPVGISAPSQAMVVPGKVKRKPIGTAAFPANTRPTLQTATVATINLVDPTEGGIIRNTMIAAHITGQGVKGTVKAVKDNRRLQNFARGTGIAAANRHVKKAWRKAANEVDSLRMQELVIRQSGTAGDVVVEDLNDNFQGEYFLERDDGIIECYGPDRKLRRTVRRTNSAQPVSTQQVVTSPRQQQVRPQNPPLQRQRTMPAYSSHQETPHLMYTTSDQQAQQPSEFYAFQEQTAYVDPGRSVSVSEPQYAMTEQNLTIEQNIVVQNDFAITQDQTSMYQEYNTQDMLGPQELATNYEEVAFEEVAEYETVDEGGYDGCYDGGGDVSDLI